MAECIPSPTTRPTSALGTRRWSALKHRATSGLALVWYTFQLLALEQSLWTDRSLEDQRRQLLSVTAPSGVLMSEPLPGTVSQIERAVRQSGLDGVVAKRSGSRYRPGTGSPAWMKVKFNPWQDFVIGEFGTVAAAFESILVDDYTDAKLTS
jgi:bifunctional non-homologous end joining protein LigD